MRACVCVRTSVRKSRSNEIICTAERCKNFSNIEKETVVIERLRADESRTTAAVLNVSQGQRSLLISRVCEISNTIGGECDTIDIPVGNTRFSNERRDFFPSA